MSGSIGDAINGIVETAIKKNPPENGDYIGDDGLLYCGKCHTARQFKMKWLDGQDRLFPVPCKCREEEAQRLKELEAKRKEIERIASLKKNSLMDKKFETSTFTDIVVTPENQKQIKLARRYVDKFSELYEKNQGLLFYGDVGTGKTHIACCIGNALMEKLVSVFATSFVKILQKSKGFKSADDEDAYIAKINSARLLILDDLGAERGTDYALEIVYNIIDTRYRSGKPMIVTTNLTMNEMQEENDIRLRRIYDRIFEVCFPVEFRGKSLRMKKAAKRYDDMAKLMEDE